MAKELDWGWAWIFHLSHESALIESAIEAGQVESATGRRYVVLDYWISTGKAH